MIQPTLKTLSRDRLYYDQYQYSLGIRLTLITAIRGFTGDFVRDRKRAEDEFDWRERILERRVGSTNNKILPEMRQEVYDFLQILCRRIDESGRDFKLVLGQGQGWLYCNDPEWIETLLERQDCFDYTRIELAYPRDTVALSRPTGFQFRTYLKEKLLSQENVTYLKNWLNNQQGIKLSGGLNSWRKYNWRNIASGYFFEHNDLRLPMMLSITVPNVVKNTKTIIVVDK